MIHHIHQHINIRRLRPSATALQRMEDAQNPSHLEEEAAAQRGSESQAENPQLVTVLSSSWMDLSAMTSITIKAESIGRGRCVQFACSYLQFGESVLVSWQNHNQVKNGEQKIILKSEPASD